MYIYNQIGSIDQQRVEQDIELLKELANKQENLS